MFEEQKMVNQVSQITGQMSNPYALNKLGFRLGYLGRLTDLVNTVGFEISSNYRGTGPMFAAKWEHSFVEAQAIVDRANDTELTCAFNDFKKICVDFTSSNWKECQHKTMKGRQTILLERIHKLQSNAVRKYVFYAAIVFAVAGLAFPVIIAHMTG